MKGTHDPHQAGDYSPVLLVEPGQEPSVAVEPELNSWAGAYTHYGSPMISGTLGFGNRVFVGSGLLSMEKVEQRLHHD